MPDTRRQGTQDVQHKRKALPVALEQKRCLHQHQVTFCRSVLDEPEIYIRMEFVRICLYYLKNEIFWL